MHRATKTVPNYIISAKAEKQEGRISFSTFLSGITLSWIPARRPE